MTYRIRYRPGREPVSIPCPVKGCPGDGRYVPPGRGHTCSTAEWLTARLCQPGGAA